MPVSISKFIRCAIVHSNRANYSPGVKHLCQIVAASFFAMVLSSSGRDLTGYDAFSCNAAVVTFKKVHCKNKKSSIADSQLTKFRALLWWPKSILWHGNAICRLQAGLHPFQQHLVHCQMGFEQINYGCFIRSIVNLVALTDTPSLLYCFLRF